MAEKTILTFKINPEILENFKEYGKKYNLDLTKALRKVIRDYNEYVAISNGNEIDISRAKKLDKFETNNKLVGVSVKIPNYDYCIYKYLCKSKDFKVKHVSRGALFIYADENINCKYNLLEENLLLEEYKKGNL